MTAAAPRLARWIASARRLKQEYDAVQGVATTATLQRSRVLSWLAVPLHLALALWFAQFQAPADKPQLQAWADAVAWLQVGVAGGLLLCGLLAHALLRSQRSAGAAGLAVQAAFCGIYLAFGAAASIEDVGVGNGIATYLAICMGTAVLSLVRPAFSALVFGGAFLVFWAILRSRAIDPTLLASLQIQAISVVLIAQLISVMMWHQYTRTVLLQRQLEFLAERDTLTGLYNRHKFMELATQELARAHRVPSETCVLMVDLDFFKRINDQHGHPVGDLVLQQVAARLTAHVRSTDLLARMGGEEFIVLMPHTDRAGALTLAEKLRTAVRERPLELPGLTVTMTASLGATGVHRQQQTTLDSLYATADQALYVAKQQGRDRVVWADLETKTT